MRGSWRAKIRKGEPQPPEGLPDPPDWLPDSAIVFYSRIGTELLGMGVMTTADRFALARLAISYATYVEAAQFIEENGRTFIISRTGKDGKTEIVHKPYPEVAIARNENANIAKLEAKFGLTPSDRCNISVNKAETDDLGAKFITNAV